MVYISLSKSQTHCSQNLKTAKMAKIGSFLVNHAAPEQNIETSDSYDLSPCEGLSKEPYLTFLRSKLQKLFNYS